ncbi:uncharacterized protein LOC133911958 [Phragmites australis]|uniref:uncharacterized protein LOC133911958 n=1 Tax=Phragmites australis TaxID=29695 RepID=UPI002D775312|nr:uncharacterized protein LOC133911958 [Phragmites australis]
MNSSKSEDMFMFSSDSSDEEDELMLLVAIKEEQAASQGRRQQRGSVPSHAVIDCGHQEGVARLFRDYFADNPVYGDTLFRHRTSSERRTLSPSLSMDPDASSSTVTLLLYGKATWLGTTVPRSASSTWKTSCTKFAVMASTSSNAMFRSTTTGVLSRLKMSFVTFFNVASTSCTWSCIIDTKRGKHYNVHLQHGAGDSMSTQAKCPYLSRPPSHGGDARPAGPSRPTIPYPRRMPKLG